MEFEITHRTAYTYPARAAEAYGEARLTPPDTPAQSILWRGLEIEPSTKTSPYTDYFGNPTEFFALPFRHTSLTVTLTLGVRTREVDPPQEHLDLGIQDVRQIFASNLTDFFDYTQPTNATCHTRESAHWSDKYLRGSLRVGDALQTLNRELHAYLTYQPGSTDNSTPLSKVWSQRRGVCQDYAHLMLSILRAGGLPARYVCGYIDAAPHPERTRRGKAMRLVGAIATHAWVEVLLPGKRSIALDPTNNCVVGEQHVAVSFGRDSRDAAPLRGTFKGSGGQKIKVEVRVKRL